MKKLLLLSLFFCLANARFIDGIVASVENQPITDYELRQTMEKTKLNRTDALNFLIRQKLEDAQITALNITATDFEVQTRAAQVAQNNGLSVTAMKDYMKSQNLSYTDFQNDLRENIKKEKLYARILGNANQNITPQNARKFYETNEQLFSHFENIKVFRYIANSKNILEVAQKSFLNTPKGVTKQELTINAARLDPSLLYIFSNAKEKAFTQIFQTSENTFEMFYIVEKTGLVTEPFEKVEQQVINAMAAQERDLAVSDYFNKARVKASVEIIR